MFSSQLITGVDEHEIEGSKDSFWKFTYQNIGDDYWLIDMSSDQMPQFTTVLVLKNHVETEVDNDLFGTGKVEQSQ